MEKLNFLTPARAESVRQTVGTPAYVYDERTLKSQAAKVLAFPNVFGLTARYAMKASPNAAILRIFDACGLHFDASSGWECDRALKAGIAAEKISLSTQEMPAKADFVHLYEAGIQFNACSLSQLETFGAWLPGREVGLRFNPGLGSGGTSKTNVGGPSSSFGIWHEFIPTVREIVAQHRLRVIRIHTHIGSGSDPVVWQKAADLSLNMVRQFPDATILNLGGGYKVGRMAHEKTTDLGVVGQPILEKFKALQAETGRALRLEIEPGTYLLANSCSLVTTIQDVVDTGAEGYHFLKLDAGMTEILRPALYAAQHPIVVLPRKKAATCSRRRRKIRANSVRASWPGPPSAICASSKARAPIARRSRPRITIRSPRQPRCSCARMASWSSSVAGKRSTRSCKTKFR